MAAESRVIDPASGLYSAEYFQDRLSEEIARACRYQRDLALLVLRVPLPVEAAFGRETKVVEAGEPSRRPGRPRRRRAGSASSASDASLADRDQVLRELGIALRECLRKADVPARIGEGLLAVALPQTREGAVVVAERIAPLLSQIAGCPVATGIAYYPADARDPAALIEIAHAKAAAGWPALPGASAALSPPLVIPASS